MSLLPPSGSHGLPERPSLRDHLRWILPVVGGLVCFLLLSQVLSPALARDRDNTTLVLLAIAGPFVLLVLAALAVIAGARCLHRLWRVHRLRRGHPNQREQGILDERRNHELAVDHARAVARDLVTDMAFDIGRPWDARLEPQERTLFDGTVHYSRYYSTTVTYDQSGGFFLGSPAFVLTGMAVTAASNRAARNAAARSAAAQWREAQVARCVVTDQRVVIHHQDGRWLSFWFGHVASAYPFIDQDLLFLEFESTEPMRLHGPAALVAAVMSVWHSHGADGLRRHPALAPLRLPAQEDEHADSPPLDQRPPAH